MSQISTLYDGFHTVIAAQLTSHYQLINPYVPELNDDLTYDAAWGLAVGPAIEPEIEQGCRIYIDQQFILTITRKLRVGDLQRNSDAITARRTKEKALLEDQFLIVKKLDQDVTMGGICVNSKLESHGGIEFVRLERYDLIMIKSIFNVKYSESLT